MKDININDFKVSSQVKISEHSTTFDLEADKDAIEDELAVVRKKLGKFLSRPS